jgi:ubiquitin conjugation factor E4 B
MKDPVILPSKNIVDRTAIHRWLLSTESDPFNRQPLKESEVMPLKDLKEEIELWKKTRV